MRERKARTGAREARSRFFAALRMTTGKGKRKAKAKATATAKATAEADSLRE
jgi:hypothetical protein